MSTETEFLEAYESIKRSYNAALARVELAISKEEAGSLEEALDGYEQSLVMIDDTFAIPVGLPDEIDAVQTQWNDACAIIQKLKSAKTEINYRMKVLRVKQSPIDESASEAKEGEQEQLDGQTAKKRPLLAENPNTFYDIANASGRPKTYRELAAGLRELLASHEAHAQLDELFQSHVKLYRIGADGQVTTLSGSTKMSLIMCTVSGKWKYLNGIYFIQCELEDQQTTEAGTSIWLYPLIPNVSNCYCTDYGAFILPDMESEQPGNAFGIMLVGAQRSPSMADEKEEQAKQDEHQADVQQFFLDLLEAVLADTVEQLHSPRSQRAATTTSEQVSKHIVCAADFIARNLVKGAEKTGGYMMRGTPYVISKLKPASPDGQTQVPSSVQTGVEVAQKVTDAAAGLTGWIAGKVGTAAVAVGGFLAPHIQTQGSKLLQKGFGYDTSQADSTMEGALTIAAGAVEGFTTVFDGFEKSAKILGNSLSENSVKIIEHKYGHEAGNLASGTFNTVGNAFVISQNVNHITPKGLAKKLAKKTGEAVVVDYKRDWRKSESHYINAGALYPDLRALKE